jgi:hypothetical protein
MPSDGRIPRPGAIVPDRRLLVSRHAEDIEALATKVNFPDITVGPKSLNDNQPNEQ